MTLPSRCWLTAIGVLAGAAGCGGGSSTGPSEAPSFLAGTWSGTLTIELGPGEPHSPAATAGSTTWTFEVVPQSNQQTFGATIVTDNSWLPIRTTGATAIIPGNTPPAQISTQGEYISPRGCRGTFGSFGTADATRIDAEFRGVDCSTTFSGRVVLQKN